MPLSSPDAPKGTCSACGESASLMGLFAPVAKPELHICFACLWVHSLKGSNCASCGADTVSAMVAVQVSENGPVAPVALCPICLPEKMPESYMIALEDGRTPAPNIPGEQ